MKSLKTLFSSLFVFVACQFNLAQADLPVYQNTIANISIGYNDNALLSGILVTANGEVMRIVDYKVKDDNVMKTWHAGDVINFTAEVKDKALVLSAQRPNDKSVEPYLIFDVKKTPKTGRRIAEITDGGKFVKLDDNSVWEFGWYNHHFTTCEWNVGERVIVQGLGGEKNSYEFINLDAPVAKKVASATASFVVR